MTAWACDDLGAWTTCPTRPNADPMGTAGPVFALLDYCDWIAKNTGPLRSGDGSRDRRTNMR